LDFLFRRAIAGRLRNFDVFDVALNGAT